MAPPIAVDKYRFVYFPIPKVACTSLKQLCADLLGKKYTNVHLLGFPSKGEPDYHRFVFVRNPWDRLVSCFLNKMKQGNRSKDSPPDRFVNGIWYGFACYSDKYGFNKNMTFTEFARAVHKIPDGAAEEHFKSQSVQFPMDAPNLHIYRFENFENDFAEMCKIIGIEPKIRYSMKTANRKHYTHYYTPETRDLIAERYANDVRNFGYEYG